MQERARLVESLHAPSADIDAKWEREIEARIAAFDRGDMPSYPAEDVFAEARSRTR